MNTYFLLFFAIILEVFGTMLLPASQNFTKIAPTSALIIAYGLSFYFLAAVSQKLPLSIVYASWSGVGIFSIAILIISRHYIYINTDINSPEQWALLGEAIQTVMRKHGIEDAYEQLKAFTRGKQLDKASIQEFINQLSIPNESKEELLKLTPRNYLGLATESLKWDKI